MNKNPVAILCILLSYAVIAWPATRSPPETVNPPTLASTGTASSAPIAVSIANVANTHAVVTDGKTVTPLGVDGNNSALLLSTVSGFNLGTPDVLDAVKATTLPLPAVRASALQLTAIGVDGNQPTQTFTVNYSDGTTSAFKQSVSDWWTPQKYPGETVVGTAPKIAVKATTLMHTVSVYSYSFAVSPSKTLKSVVLPLNNHVVILAGTVTPVVNATATLDTVALSWSAPTTNMDGTPALIASYNIYKGTQAQVTKYATVQAPTTTFSDPLTCGTMVNYSVTAVSTSGQESAQSPQVGKACNYFAPTNTTAIK